MRSFAALSIAALVASTVAMPTYTKDDDKYASKHVSKPDESGKKEEHSDWKPKEEHSDWKEDDKKDEWKEEDDKAKHDSLSAFPFHFRSTYHAVARPDMIINSAGATVPGEKGAVGYFNFGVNPWQEVICYNITLVGVTGEYSSPAKTATHLHAAAEGAFGPPRLSFPNPTGDDWTRTSVGCLQGPFTTGLKATSGDLEGQDTATGFSLWDIEANPGGFAADTHTSKYLAGAVRGQLYKVD